MAVVVETTLGDLTVDLFIQQRPRACLNFLKLCKLKYYNYNLFHTIQHGFIAQTGDPTGEGSGGQSVWGLLNGSDKRYFQPETNPKIKHDEPGTLSMVTTDDGMVASQFFFTLSSNLNSLDSRHCIIGQVTEGLETLRLINETICDTDHRPYQDVRITHTVILEDPFDDPEGLREPSRSPSPSAERLAGGRIAPDEEIDETKGKTAEELAEMIQEREAKARATILEIVGDLPDAEVAPPENVLFVCKLNPVTTDDDLEIIFSRFGTIKSCEVIRDKKTGDSLQYAFIEFEDKKSCEDAYFKMDNVLIDDRRIHVDFSQSVSQLKWKGKGKGVIHMNDMKNDDLKNFTGRSPDRERSKDHQKKHFNNKNRNNDSEYDSRHRNDETKDNRRERHREIENRHYKSENNDRYRADKRDLRYEISKNDNGDKSREMKQNDKHREKSPDRGRYRERRDERTPEKFRNKTFEYKDNSNYRPQSRRDFDRRRNRSPERRRERSHERTRNKTPELTRGKHPDANKEKYGDRKGRENESRNRNRKRENCVEEIIKDDYTNRTDDRHKKSFDYKYKPINNCSKNGSKTPTSSPKHRSSNVSESNNSNKEKYERTESNVQIKYLQKSSKNESRSKKRKDKSTPPEESSDECSPAKKRKKSHTEKQNKNSSKKKQDDNDSTSNDNSSDSDEKSNKKSKDRKKPSKVVKKKKKYSSSSSESSSSSSSDSSDESSESSSDSAPKKKKTKKNISIKKDTKSKKNKRANNSSSSSSSSTDSESSSSSTDSSDSGHEQSRKKSKNKKSVREKLIKKKSKK